MENAARSPGVIISIMRKFIFALVAAVALLSFTGCEKEQDTLSGTTWVSGSTTIEFSGIACKIAFSNGEEYYSYEYSHPTVIMYPANEEMATLKGIISDDVMSVVNMSNEKTIGLFTRQRN